MCFLKNIFRIYGLFGVFPLTLESNSVIRNIHLMFYFISTFTGIICIPFEFKTLVGIFGIEVQDFLIYPVTQLLCISINLICTYGLFKKRESWRHFFDMIDNLNTKFSIDIKFGQPMKLGSFLLTTILMYYCEFVLRRGQTITFVTIVTYFFWSSSYVKSIGVTITIWAISKMLTAYYSQLCINVLKTFSYKRCKSKCICEKLIYIKENINLLHEVVTHINGLMGKMLFVLLAYAFLSILSFFNFIIFLTKSNNASELFGISFTSVILCMELVVST